jgi:hypothetical protein
MWDMDEELSALLASALLYPPVKRVYGFWTTFGGVLGVLELNYPTPCLAFSSLGDSSRLSGGRNPSVRTGWWNCDSYKLHYEMDQAV